MIKRYRNHPDATKSLVAAEKAVTQNFERALKQIHSQKRRVPPGAMPNQDPHKDSISLMFMTTDHHPGIRKNTINYDSIDREATLTLG